MRPVSVRFQCFGPYMQEQCIDFEKLAQSGLFLICGETGAGKTTILDAMSYALYNQSSGNSRGKGLAAMRCKLAEKTDLTFVEFIFSANGKEYKFLRTLEFKRKNARDEHQCWEKQGDVWIPLFENPKESLVSGKAQAILGLTYDQFRQVMILPQGQFEKLLVSDSEEKEKILVSLFHADRWQKMAEELYRRAKLQDQNLRQERASIDAKLQEYRCDTLEALEETAEALKEDCLQLQEETAAALADTAALRGEKEEALLLDSQFQRLAQLRRAYDGLAAKEASYQRHAAELAMAERAQILRPDHEALQRSRQALDKLGRQQAQCTADERSAAAALALQQQRQQRHQAERPQWQAAQQRHTLLESKQPVYLSLQEKERDAKSAADTEAKASALHQSAEQAFTCGHIGWLHALDSQKEAMDRYLRAQQIYLQGIGAELAKTLQDGVPCPVCGSTSHPHPAGQAADHITEAQLDGLNQAVLQAGKAVSAASDKRNRAEKQMNEAAADHAIARELAVNRRKDLELALEQRIPGIDTITGLHTALQDLQKKIAAYETEEQAVQTALQQADSRHQIAKAALTQTNEAWGAQQRETALAEQQWSKALADSGLESEDQYLSAALSPEELNRRKEALIGYQAELTAARQAWEAQHTLLEGQTPPALQQLTTELQNKEAALQALQAQAVLRNNRLQNAERDILSLRSRLHLYMTQRRDADDDLLFAEQLRGSRGLSLQRYVLGVMLSSITAEANRLLQNVYGGRYQLFRSETIGDRRQKSGLDLEVLDHANGQRRSVKTLSGGEKFLVALSLAIGLSTVVQAQGSGVHLDAMFVDEGFGSLDRDAIGDALDILDGIRKGSGMVGIISHVEQLQESIQARIEVGKSRTGSVCRVIA